MDDLKGHLEPVVIEGRAPVRIDEIVLGVKTFDALGVELGDTIRVGTVRTRTLPMRIVGRGVVEMGRDIELGQGAAMSFAAYKPIAPSSLEGCCHALEVRFRPGAGEPAMLSRLQQPFVNPARGLPTTVADFGGVDAMPLVLSALVAVIAAGALAHTLVMAIRRRRRDLAILKTLGFDRRQVLATVAWQSTTFAAVGLLVGLPLGVAAGRWAWNLFADELGVVPEPVTPGLLILLVVPGAVLLANLVAAIPAGIAARTRPAVVLRAE
jgi:ABC-type lipoprotein release transport system permease subunit